LDDGRDLIRGRVDAHLGGVGVEPERAVAVGGDERPIGAVGPVGMLIRAKVRRECGSMRKSVLWSPAMVQTLSSPNTTPWASIRWMTRLRLALISYTYAWPVSPAQFGTQIAPAPEARGRH
jgi:hypothetical protein